MKPIPMLNMDDPDFDRKFREACGIGPKETITATFPQFTREPGAVGPAAPPADRDAWNDLYEMPIQVLRELGLRGWDEPDARGRVLMLLPGEWYWSIPDGWLLVCISGRVERFRRGKTDNDIRCGCLAYGVLTKEARVNYTCISRREAIAQIDTALLEPDPTDLTEAEAVERLTAAMREARLFGHVPDDPTRAYLRDCLLPALAKHGLRLVRATEKEEK